MTSAAGSYSATTGITNTSPPEPSSQRVARDMAFTAAQKAAPRGP